MSTLSCDCFSFREWGEISLIDLLFCHRSVRDLDLDDFNSRSSSGNEDDPPEVKMEKEKERRQANNARER